MTMPSRKPENAPYFGNETFQLLKNNLKITSKEFLLSKKFYHVTQAAKTNIYRRIDHIYIYYKAFNFKWQD